MISPRYGKALITGASGGIGAEFARQLSLAGWELIAVGRDEARLEALLGSLEGAGARGSVAVVADLSEPSAAERLYGECERRGLEVELLVNNAGSGLFGRSDGLPAPKVEAMLRLNVLALTELCALFARGMRERGGGRILNVGSVAGEFALPYFASYAASKSYVLSYSLALRAELRRDRVGVTCLLPGYVRTGFDAAAGISSPAYLAFSSRAGMSAAAVARAGLRALASDRPCSAAGFQNKLAAALGRLAPRSAVPAAAGPILGRMAAAAGPADGERERTAG
jgi:short-subunit dehydrogenase